jgi:hypothetical protein
MTNDHFVVSSCDYDNDDVVEVDTKRLQVVVSYKNQLKSTSQHKFSYPRHLSVDKNNEFILVVDRDNNRIVILDRNVMLNRSWKCDARELNMMTSIDGGFHWLSCVYFNSSQNRLFVGDWRGRVSVFDNVI